MYPWSDYTINIIKKQIYCNERFTCHFCLTIFIIENNTIKEFQNNTFQNYPTLKNLKIILNKKFCHTIKH